MGQQIIKQTLVGGKPLVIDGQECEPGKYSVWSSVVDNFVFFNGTKEELIEWHVEQAIRREKVSLEDRLERVEQYGFSGHGSFGKNFEEAVAWAREIHGEAAFDEHEDDVEKRTA